MTNRVKEQHIAVFGESGSGKTVLLSSFFGATQEPSLLSGSSYRVVANDIGQGNLLRQNYLQMRNQAQAPQASRFAAVPYRFTIRPHTSEDEARRSKPGAAAMELVWHDYPGEWFVEEPSSEQERERRIDTFTKLLKSDVALILVDGQMLIDYRGEEERYLKSMLWSMRGGLENLRDNIEQ
ncbi:MAG: TRAFAC clade GTPase domain-containing protein [Arachnia sp.]